MKAKTQPTIRERVAEFLFGDIIDQAKKAALAAVSVRVDDCSGWDAHQPGPADRAWHEIKTDQDDALEAWRKNFMARRITTLITSYVVANGITLTSTDPDVQQFINDFWHDPDNHLDQRLPDLCDELTRAGELFPVLYTLQSTGMSIIRFVPGARIREIQTDPDDYEKEIQFGQIKETSAEPFWWIGPAHRNAFARARGGRGGWHLRPLMLHYTINKPVGAVRGEGDLTPILPWCRRYTEWLKDRVRLNRQRTRQGMMDVTLDDDSLVEEKRRQLQTSNPIEAGIYVHGKGEEVAMHSLKIEADEAREDGRALRLAVATGANIGLHYMGEGETVNYATAKEMGEPTARFYAMRQKSLCFALVGIVTAAYRRRAVVLGQEVPARLPIVAQTTEVARADNASLSEAAYNIVRALATQYELGLRDDRQALQWIYKFAGETIADDEIDRILKQNGGNANAND